MQSSEFEERIKELRDARIPTCPPGLEVAALRRVQEALRTRRTSLWDWLHHWVQRPRFAAAALMVAASSTAATSALAVRLHAPAKTSMAQQALGFETFIRPSAPKSHQP